MASLLLAIIYAAFISLGLPDALLGSAWPVIYPEFGVPVSASGVIFMIIAVGTVVSSLLSDRLIRRFGTGRVTLVSVLATAAALFGFSGCRAYWMLCLWAIPYGLGAGSVDAALNNYVALNYASRHMSWLHCMWGVGASLGPAIMGAVLTGGGHWSGGYLRVGVLQIALTAVLLISLPLWRKVEAAGGASKAETSADQAPLSLRQVAALPGAKAAALCFFCYCAVEQTTGLWASSYLVLVKGVAPATAARYASMFYLGITAGRALSGFLTLKLDDRRMVRLGFAVILLGALCMLLPLGSAAALAGFIVIGLGCAPVYPCLLHATPDHFGANHSQAVMGVQMASAYIGTSLMPPLFGWLAQHTTFAALPLFLLAALAAMFLAHQRLTGKAVIS